MTMEQINEYLKYAFIASFVINIFYWLFFYIRISFYKEKETEVKEFPEVSIIIAARNEAENLKKNLPAFLTQDYPNYKVIVVNDASTDDSASILAEMKLKYKNLYVTTIPFNEVYKHGKKTALSIGIKAAKTDILLFSDADCIPVSDQWIKSFVLQYDKYTEFVIGFGAYQHKKGLLDKIIRSDTIYNAMNYLGMGLAGIPYMAVGRNMSYRKSTFERVKGFTKYFNLLSGSDDLFVNKNANKKNAKVVLSKNSFTESEQKTSFKDWKYQKIRHLSTAKYYKFWHKVLLFIEPFSRILFYSLSIILFILSSQYYLISSILLLKLLINAVILSRINFKLNQHKILFFELIFDIIQPILNLFLMLKVNKKTNLIWK